MRDRSSGASAYSIRSQNGRDDDGRQGARRTDSRRGRRGGAWPGRRLARAELIGAEVAEEVRALGGVGLVTVLVGDDPASQVYIRLKHQAAAEAGIVAEDLRLPETTSEAELLEIRA